MSKEVKLHIVFRTDGRSFCGLLNAPGLLKFEEILDWGLTPDQKKNLCKSCEETYDNLIESGRLVSSELH